MQPARSTKSAEKSRRTLFRDGIARSPGAASPISHGRESSATNGSDSRLLDVCQTTVVYTDHAARQVNEKCRKGSKSTFSLTLFHRFTPFSLNFTHTGEKSRHQTGRTAAFSTVASPLWCMPIMQAARSTKSDEKARRTLIRDDIARCGITKFTYTSERDRHQNGSDSRPLDGCRPPDGLSMWTVHQDSPLSPSRQSIDAMNRLIHVGCVP